MSPPNPRPSSQNEEKPTGQAKIQIAPSPLATGSSPKYPVFRGPLRQRYNQVSQQQWNISWTWQTKPSYQKGVGRSYRWWDSAKLATGNYIFGEKMKTTTLNWLKCRQQWFYADFMAGNFRRLWWFSWNGGKKHAVGASSERCESWTVCS